MNLKTLALVACCLLMPAVASSQDSMGMMSGKDSMKMHKDSMKMHKDSMKMDKKMMDKKMDKKMHKEMHKEMHKDGSGMAMKTGNGPECARGCPTSTGVAGLTGVQFLALQQELRDRGCGNSHVTGVLDAPTKAAIKACAAKMNVAPTAAAVLTAMNIGYTVGG